MKSLYRKYRPLKLTDVIGQEQVTKPLINSLKQGKIFHAYLLVGPRGCGKTSVARILAHEVNDFEYTIEDEYVDIIEIDGASNRGIDNIRELREKAAIAPTKGKYKVYIIDEVHMLTKEAFNALLKTLEEPPSHVIFIMATTDAYKVPVTITSRAQTFTFKLADKSVMFNHLKKIAENEKIPIDDDALLIIAKRGGGSFRDSLSLLDQISTLSDEKITKELVISALGLPSDEIITKLFDSFLKNNTANITTLVKEILASGIKPETLAEEMITEIIDNPQPELLPLLEKLTDVKSPFPEAKLLLALTSSPAYNAFTATAGEKLIIAPKKPMLSSNSSPKPPVIPKKNDSPDKERVTEPGTVLAVDFNWDGFIDKVRGLNDAIYAQLLKTKHRFAGNQLDIYPLRKIVKTILSRDTNKRILVEAAGSNVKITIHDIDELSDVKSNDAIIDKMSAIMGGEVENDAGGNPFQE